MGNRDRDKKGCVCLTLPQSRREEEVADAIFAFFLLFFSFSPACTTSLESVRQLGIDWFLVVLEVHPDCVGSRTDQPSQGPSRRVGSMECGLAGLPRLHSI